jgi:hypothetical protein
MCRVIVVIIIAISIYSVSDNLTFLSVYHGLRLEKTPLLIDYSNYQIISEIITLKHRPHMMTWRRHISTTGTIA